MTTNKPGAGTWTNGQDALVWSEGDRKPQNAYYVGGFDKWSCQGKLFATSEFVRIVPLEQAIAAPALYDELTRQHEELRQELDSPIPVSERDRDRYVRLGKLLALAQGAPAKGGEA